MVECRLDTVTLRLVKTCPDMDRLNGTFNFSMNEAITILLDYKNENRNLGPVTEGILIAVYGSLMVLGILSNLLISIVVCRRPHLHTARNLYIVNLTVSDMTLCLICMPFTLVALLRKHWTLGTVLCKSVPALQGTNIMVSIGTITVIALDRYITIVRGQDGGGAKRVIISILLVWLFSFAATLPVVYYQEVVRVDMEVVILYEMCIERWPSLTLKVTYAVVLLLIQAVIPVTVVSLVHARIASHLHAHAKTQRDSRRAQRELNRNRRTTLILTGVAVVFGVSWLPLGLFSLLADLVPLTAEQVYTGLAVCHVLAMSSALSNPVIYGWFNSNIRQELIQLLPKGARRRGGGPLNGGGHQEEPTVRTALPTRSCRTSPPPPQPPPDVTYTAL